MKNLLIIISLICVLNASTNFLGSSAGGGSDTSVSFSNGCELGNGFDLTHGCLSSALDITSVAQTCDPTNFNPCKEELPFTQQTSYTSQIFDQKDFSATMDTIASGEGSQTGQSVSVSAGFMHSSQVSSKSATFVLGQNLKTHKTHIKNSQLVKLSTAATAILQTNPHLFLETYGTHYVSEFQYGGSFIGSYDIYESSTSSSNSVSIMASFKSNEVFYSASASASFNASLSQSNKHITTRANAINTGGNLIEFNPQKPKLMGDSFLEWQRSFTKENAVPQVMTFRNWFDLKEVAEIITSKFPELISLFNPQKLTEVTLYRFNKEVNLLYYLEHDLKQTQQWSCLQSEPDLRKQINLIEEKTLSLHSQIQSMSEAAYLAQQIKIQMGDFSFFKADSYVTEYRTLLSQFKEKCGRVCLENSYIQEVQRSSNALKVECPPNAAATGVRFTHSKGQDYTYQEYYGMGCTNNPRAPLLSNSERLPTQWMKNSGTGIQEHHCPKDQFMAGLENSNPAHHDYIYDRSFRLWCQAANAELGYSIEYNKCVDTQWHIKDNYYADYNNYDCPQGSVITGIRFQHDNDDYYAWQEKVNLQCCPLVASFIGC